MRQATLARLRTIVGLLSRPSGIKSLWHRLVEKAQDRRLRINTARIVSLEELGIEDRACHDYVATKYGDFREIMRRIPIRENHDVFLDFGSGMGRVLIMAARLPFRRVIGVEFIEELHMIAKRNLVASSKGRKCQDVLSVHCDASEYQVPDDVTMAFFFNPFHGSVLEKVLDNLSGSLSRAPRRLKVIASVPRVSPSLFEQGVGECEWLKRNGEFNLSTDGRCVVYESK